MENVDEEDMDAFIARLEIVKKQTHEIKQLQNKLEKLNSLIKK